MYEHLSRRIQELSKHYKSEQRKTLVECAEATKSIRAKEELRNSKILGVIIGLLEGPKIPEQAVDLVYTCLVIDVFRKEDVVCIIEKISKNNWCEASKMRILQMSFYFLRYDIMKKEEGYKLFRFVLGCINSKSALSSAARPICIQLTEILLNHFLSDQTDSYLEKFLTLIEDEISIRSNYLISFLFLIIVKREGIMAVEAIREFYRRFFVIADAILIKDSTQKEDIYRTITALMAYKNVYESEIVEFNRNLMKYYQHEKNKGIFYDFVANIVLAIDSDTVYHLLTSSDPIESGKYNFITKVGQCLMNNTEFYKKFAVFVAETLPKMEDTNKEAMIQLLSNVVEFCSKNEQYSTIEKLIKACLELKIDSIYDICVDNRAYMKEAWKIFETKKPIIQRCCVFNGEEMKYLVASLTQLSELECLMDLAEIQCVCDSKDVSVCFNSCVTEKNKKIDYDLLLEAILKIDGEMPQKAAILARVLRIHRNWNLAFSILKQAAFVDKCMAEIAETASYYLCELSHANMSDLLHLNLIGSTSIDIHLRGLYVYQEIGNYLVRTECDWGIFKEVLYVGLDFVCQKSLNDQCIIKYMFYFIKSMKEETLHQNMHIIRAFTREILKVKDDLVITEMNSVLELHRIVIPEYTEFICKDICNELYLESFSQIVSSACGNEISSVESVSCEVTTSTSTETSPTIVVDIVTQASINTGFNTSEAIIGNAVNDTEYVASDNTVNDIKHITNPDFKHTTNEISCTIKQTVNDNKGMIQSLVLAIENTNNKEILPKVLQITAQFPFSKSELPLISDALKKHYFQDELKTEILACFSNICKRSNIKPFPVSVILEWAILDAEVLAVIKQNINNTDMELNVLLNKLLECPNEHLDLVIDCVSAIDINSTNLNVFIGYSASLLDTATQSPITKRREKKLIEFLSFYHSNGKYLDESQTQAFYQLPVTLAHRSFMNLRLKSYQMLFIDIYRTKGIVVPILKTLIRNFVKDYLSHGEALQAIRPIELTYCIKSLESLQRADVIDELKTELIELLVCRDHDILVCVRNCLRILFS